MRMERIYTLVKLFLVMNSGHAYQTGCNSKPYWRSSGFSSCVFISTEQGPDVLSWQQAHDKCVSINSWSTLAVLPTDEHDAVIASTAKNSTAYWVGIRVPVNSSRPYTWMDGTVETRNSIFPGNPSSIAAVGGSPTHLCGHVTLTIQPAHRQLTWSFGQCHKGHPYICIVDNAHIDDKTSKNPVVPATQTTKLPNARPTNHVNVAIATPTTVRKASSTQMVISKLTYGMDLERNIKATLKCPAYKSAAQCLLTTLPSSKPLVDSHMVWRSTLLFLDGMLSELALSTPANVSTIAGDILLLLSTILQQRQQGRLSYFNKNVGFILKAIDKFADILVVRSVDVPDKAPIVGFTSTSLEIKLTKERVSNIRGKEINLKWAKITMDDVFNKTSHRAISDSDEITILAMVSDAPEGMSWLVGVDEGDRKPREIRVPSPILTLSASVRGQLVSLEHRFRLMSPRGSKSPSNKQVPEPLCSFRLKGKNRPCWNTAGCQTVLRTIHEPCGLQKNSTEMNNTSTFSLHAAEYSVEGNCSNAVECHCNHTTSFAIVMSVVDIKLDEANAMALDIITYIGCGLTIVSMCIAITVFTCIRSLDSERVCVHRNLCVAILISQLIFLMGVQAVSNKAVCRLVALLLHYFYMATFVWMLVEGLHLYSQVVRVFGTEKSRLTYYVCFGWGFPFLEVAVSASIDWQGYGTNRSCWLSIERSTIWACIGPALSILFVNLLILTVVMRIIILAAKVEKMDEVNHIRAGVKASLFLSPLLGVTWLFGLAAVNKDLLVFQYIFAILNSLQGFFIFLYHCVLNTDVRQTLKRMKEKRMVQRELGTSSGSSQRASCSENRTD